MDFSLTTSLYVLNIGAASGTPLVSTWANLGYNNGMPFTTVDSDNDQNFGDNCAVVTQSGWWHRWCYWVNLNGQYATPGTATILGSGWQLGIVHRGFTDWIAFKSSSMMVRRI
ncbi:fibrinogen-like protein 1 [Ruditapes philippinarum]|nr:fibrinogen-like protein 1 [Ruditapes philippinarum]